MSPKTIRKIGIILRNGGAVVAAASFLVALGLDSYFSTFSTVPFPERGLTSGHNIHGTIHYVPSQLQTAFDWAFNIGFYTVVAIAVGMFLLSKPNRR